MRWAKCHQRDGEFQLTFSAVPPLDWSALGMDPESLALFSYSRYGEELGELLAQRWQLPASHALIASSTTHAHFCFAASVVQPGDRVLHECPGYSPLVDALSVLHIEARAVRRRFEDGYRLPLESIAAEARAGARLLLVTDLHNPSGVALREGEMAELAALSRETGMVVLCDEIYRPFLDPDPGPWHRRFPEIISVMGLNKVHGLPQIRFGWGFADDARVLRARRILDSTTVHNSCLTDQVAAHAIPHMPRLEERARAIAREGWRLLEPWLQRSALEYVEPDGGLVCLPKVPSGFASGDEYREAALEVGVNLVPGRFFGAPDHVRLGFGQPIATLESTIARLDMLAGL